MNRLYFDDGSFVPYSPYFSALNEPFGTEEESIYRFQSRMGNEQGIWIIALIYAPPLSGEHQPERISHPRNVYGELNFTIL